MKRKRKEEKDIAPKSARNCWISFFGKKLKVDSPIDRSIVTFEKNKMQSLEAVLAFFLLLTGNAITYPADTSVTLPFPVENSVPYPTAESSQDSDIQECLNRSEKFCSCYVVNKSGLKNLHNFTLTIRIAV